MTPMEDAIAQTVSSMWELLIGGTIAICDDPDGEVASDARALAGCIHVTGADGGVITIECPEILARACAAALFQVPVGALDLREAQDALAEMANIIGGNFKALLGAGHYLSLPTVVEGRDFRTRFVGTRLEARVAFDTDAGRLVASFFKDAARVGVRPDDRIATQSPIFGATTS